MKDAKMFFIEMFIYIFIYFNIQLLKIIFKKKIVLIFILL